MSVQAATIEDDAIRKAMRRLLPLAMLLFFFSLLDRTNISFAALEMNKDLGLSPSQYGTAASIFFVGYVLFEIPSNILLERIGARVWLARIMITWGAIVAAMAFVEGTASLYVLRLLLGIAEAGLLPGLLLYLGQWLPARQRGVAYSILLMTTTLAYAVGAPLTTALMQLPLFGYRGWQSMFLVQGLLTIAVGVLTIVVLPSRIRDASWLSAAEKASLQARIDAEEAAKRAVGATERLQGFFDRRVLVATLFCFFLVCTNFGTVLWLPQIVKATFPALDNVKISLLISFAFLVGGIAGLIAGRRSDRTGDRKWHLIASAAIGTIGFLAAGAAPTPILRFAGVCVGVLGIWSMFGVFWAYNGDLLGGKAAAGGLALINSLGSIGGIVAPLVLGWARDSTGSFAASLYALGGFALLTVLSGFGLKAVRRQMPAMVTAAAE